MNKINFLWALFIIGVTVMPLPLPAQTLKLSPGNYDHLLFVGMQKDRLTAFYENYTGWDEEAKSPRFSCIFFIEGVIKGKDFPIMTYYPEKGQDEIINGRLTLLNKNHIKIKLERLPDGCSMVEANFDKAGVDFKLLKKTDWLQIRVIADKKAYLYQEPKDATKRKSYVIRGDVVTALKMKGNWLYVAYKGKKATSKGWIKKSTLFKPKLPLPN